MKIASRRAACARFLFALLCLTLLTTTLLPLNAAADMGPKPSVPITVKGLPDGVCWGTLLSKTPSTGPASVWGGDENHKSDFMNPELWPFFAAYEDADGFYFLQWMWDVTEESGFSWSYYPPETFKVLLYFPDTDAWVESEICTRYAFDSYYTMDLTGVTLRGGATVTAPVRRSYDFSSELRGLAARILVTLIIEIAVALLFGIRQRKPLLVILAANLTTQLILNGILLRISYTSGPAAFRGWYLFSELLVFAAEAIVYARTFPRLTEGKITRRRAVLYALAANALSFGGGILLSRWLPEIF